MLFKHFSTVFFFLSHINIAVTAIFIVINPPQWCLHFISGFFKLAPQKSSQFETPCCWHFARDLIENKLWLGLKNKCVFQSFPVSANVWNQSTQTRPSVPNLNLAGGHESQPLIIRSFLSHFKPLTPNLKKPNTLWVTCVCTSIRSLTWWACEWFPILHKTSLGKHKQSHPNTKRTSSPFQGEGVKPASPRVLREGNAIPRRLFLAYTATHNAARWISASSFPESLVRTRLRASFSGKKGQSCEPSGRGRLNDSHVAGWNNQGGWFRFHMNTVTSTWQLCAGEVDHTFWQRIHLPTEGGRWTRTSASLWIMITSKPRWRLYKSRLETDILNK